MAFDKEKYEIEREARRPVYEKLIAILLADPLGWEMMCKQVRGTDSFDASLPTVPLPDKRCKCDGPFTCQEHRGEFRWCDNPKCACHCGDGCKGCEGPAHRGASTAPENES